MIVSITKAIIFLPLISGVFNGIFCKKINQHAASFISIITITISAFFAVYLFVIAGINKQLIYITITKWLNIDSISINWAIYVDQLTAIMFLLITFVSSVVHIYSIGYMKKNTTLPKFLSYLSLFTFCMLVLVSSDNFLQLFFGWEGVGLCSYLLIGYFYQRDSANNAAIKAFVVNRIGDVAFIIGVIIILTYVGSIEFTTVFAQNSNLANTMITILGYDFIVLDVICFMLFIGCMGKSAQIGMHIWLPDAMEGPTPVSALIHSATMVTSGVFLLARCSFIFEYSPNVLFIITVVGSITCFFAASIAISQTDLKKIIAYSTCSQLGYMFFACGVSAYQAGIFHLVTHGLFKALLFLSAGSVIRATHEQEIFKMGGLWNKMPITYSNFWVGSLAISGIFPLSGFYSKDLILEEAYVAGNVGSFAFTLGVSGALLTAIYSFKIIQVTFHGKTRLDKAIFEQIHESPKIMNAPLLILVTGALFSGMICYYILAINDPVGYFYGSIFNLNLTHKEYNIPLSIHVLPLITSIIGIIMGIYCYRNDFYKKLSKRFYAIHFLLKNKYFFDEFYNKVFVRVFNALSSFLAHFDTNVINRYGPDGLTYLIRGVSWCICKIQTGYIFNYVLYITCTLVFCITIFIFRYLFTPWFL